MPACEVAAVPLLPYPLAVAQSVQDAAPASEYLLSSHVEQVLFLSALAVPAAHFVQDGLYVLSPDNVP
jgi:hypothetical protein